MSTKYIYANFCVIRNPNKNVESTLGDGKESPPPATANTPYPPAPFHEL